MYREFFKYIKIFYRKDFLEAYSYKLQFFSSFFVIFVNIFLFFFLSKFISSGNENTYENSSYFGFVIVGICLFDISYVLVSRASQAIINYKLSGTFEELFLYPIPKILIVLMSYPYAISLSLVRASAYFLISYFIFGLEYLILENLFELLIFIILFFILFVGIGLISAATTIIFQRYNIIPLIHTGISSMMGGIIYPPSLISDHFDNISFLVPIYMPVNILRELIYNKNYMHVDMLYDLLFMAIYSILFFMLGLYCCKKALKVAKNNGSLIFY